MCVIPAKKLYDLQKQSSTIELKEVFYQGVTKRTNKRWSKTEENQNENKNIGKELSAWLPFFIIIIVNIGKEVFDLQKQSLNFISNVTMIRQIMRWLSEDEAYQVRF